MKRVFFIPGVVLLTTSRHISFTSFYFRRYRPYTVSGTNYSLLVLPCRPIEFTFQAVNRCDAASRLCVQSDVLLLHCEQSSLIFLQQSAQGLVARRPYCSVCVSCECQVFRRPLEWNIYSVCLFVCSCLCVCCRTSSILKNYLTTVWSGKLSRIKINCVVKVFHVLVEKYEIVIQIGKALRKWPGVLLQILILERNLSQHSCNYTYQTT
jgi:hypothetical protein